MRGQERFGRGLTKLSWAAGKSSKQKFSLAQINPSSQVDLPQEAETKRVPGKSELSFTGQIIHPILPACSIGPLFAKYFTSDSMGHEASLRVASTSTSTIESMGSRSGLVLQNGESAKVGVWTPYYCGFQVVCTCAYANRKVHLSYVAYPAYCFLTPCQCTIV